MLFELEILEWRTEDSCYEKQANKTTTLVTQLSSVRCWVFIVNMSESSKLIQYWFSIHFSAQNHYPIIECFFCLLKLLLIKWNVTRFQKLIKYNSSICLFINDLRYLLSVVVEFDWELCIVEIYRNRMLPHSCTMSSHSSMKTPSNKQLEAYTLSQMFHSEALCFSRPLLLISPLCSMANFSTWFKFIASYETFDTFGLYS